MLGVSKETFTRKIGPLPVWAWMLIGLAVAVIIAVIRDNRDRDKKAAEESTDDPYSDEVSVDLIGGNQNPPIVFQNYNQPVYMPGAGGRTTPPVAPPVVTTPPAPAKPTPLPGIKPGPAPAKPAPAGPTGWWITVSKYTTKNPPWNSTLSGIAKHFYAQGANAWPIIWNAPQNSALKTRRKKPELIQPGDKIWVPKR
jgi:hypothetical protein